MTFVDFTDDELRALARRFRLLPDPGREKHLHSAYGKALRALHDEKAFEPKPPFWIDFEDELPEGAEPQAAVVVTRCTFEGARSKEALITIASEELQAWEVMAMLHVAHEGAIVKTMRTERL